MIESLRDLGKGLLGSGLLLAATGAVLFVSGRLPGDIVIRKKQVVFAFPLATCLLASLVLTFLFSALTRR